MIRNFLRNEEGQGMVEYGLIIALIAVVVIVALKALGGGVNSVFEKTVGTLEEQGIIESEE